MAPKPAPAQAAEPAPAPAQDTQQQQSQQQSSGGGAAMAYQYQFGAFYSGFWSMGWFGYKDGNYKPGPGNDLEVHRHRQELVPAGDVRAGAPEGQRRRLAVVALQDGHAARKPIMYEFLVGPDTTVDEGALQGS